MTSPTTTPGCPKCGTALAGAGTVEGLCSVCLLSGALSQDAIATEIGTEAARPRRPGPTLSPIGTGIVAPAWAMPAELLRQAAQRLRLAAVGVALTFAAVIVVINLFEAMGWQSPSRLALRNMIAAAMIGASAGVVWLAHTGRLAPTRLLMVSLGYEVAVAFAISLGDHLEPMGDQITLITISWLCVWIVIFPVFVPASPRWAFLAGVVSASCWPLAYFVGLALGNPSAPARVVALNSLDGYYAAALAMFATLVIRGLQELGCYRLLERLDHGGMGEIWRARHRMLARPVAVKLIRPELLGVKNPVDAAALVARFQREAEATAALHSSHTVALHDFGVTPEGTFYYVMELLEGIDLETLVRRFGPVPPERAIHLLIQACDSLAEAHASGLVHRDVKPANMLTCHFGLKWDFVKVLDFGLVKSAWSMGDDERLSTEGTITGTPAYMAPEAVLGTGSIDARVDLYGLGCVAYWLLTGERLFVGRTPVEVLLHHARTPPVPPSERSGRHVPPELEALVLACLAKDPEDRPPSAEWLAARLAECPTSGAWTPARAQEWWAQNFTASAAAPLRGDTRTATAATPPS